MADEEQALRKSGLRNVTNYPFLSVSVTQFVFIIKRYCTLNTETWTKNDLAKKL